MFSKQYKNKLNNQLYSSILGIILFLVTATSQAADLSMNVSASPATAYVDQELTYTVSLFPVRVGSSRVVNSAVLSYGLPQGFELVSATPSQGTCASDSVVECELGDLSSTQTVIIVVKPTATGSVTSSVFASGVKIDENTDEIVSTTTSVVLTTVVTDPPPIQLDFSEATYVVTEGQGVVASIIVTRTGDDDRAVSVDFNTEDGTAVAGSDYESISGTLSWEAGDTSPKDFTIQIIDDREAEREETISLILSNPVSASLGRANAVLSLQDDETTGVIEFSTVNYIASEESGVARITVLRNSGSDISITVNYATSNGTAVAGEDYTTSSGSLFWADNDTDSKTFEVPIINDDIIEGDQNVTLILTAADEAVLGQRTATLTIVDEFTEQDAVSALESAASNPTQRAMAEPVGNLCQSGQAGTDLQARCRELITNAAINSNAVANALQQWAPEEYASQGRMAVEFSSRQFRNLSTRLIALRGGMAGGGELKLDNLKVDVQGVPVPTDIGKPASGTSKPGKLPPGVAHKYDLYKLGGFISGDMSFGDKDNTDRESGFDFSSTGITAGLDYRFNDQLILGAALGFGKATSDFFNGGQIESENYNFSIYGTYYKAKKFYLDAIVSFARNNYDSKRNIFYRIADTQVNQTASSNPSGDGMSISVSAGYLFQYESLKLTPIMRIDRIKADVEAFRENLSSPYAAGGQLGVALNSQSVTSTTVAIGGSIAYEIEAEWAKILPEFRFEWIHELDNDMRFLSGKFIHDASGQQFSLPTDDPDSSYFSMAMGMDIEYGEGQSFFVSYQTLLGMGSVTHNSIMGGIKIEF